MRKNQNTEPDTPIEEKHKGFRTWKSVKRWVTIAGITLVTLGTVGRCLHRLEYKQKLQLLLQLSQLIQRPLVIQLSIGKITNLCIMKLTKQAKNIQNLSLNLETVTLHGV